MVSGGVPTATRWLLGSVGEIDNATIRSVYLVFSERTGLKGTGFNLQNGPLITNEHVIRGSAATDLTVISSEGKISKVARLVQDPDFDLAALHLRDHPSDGLLMSETVPPMGQRVHTWGYPLAYNGPSPILSVGYIAGFNPFQARDGSRVVQHYVVNGAFNPGNSGGPLILADAGTVVGVVVSKHAPISQFTHRACLSGYAGHMGAGHMVGIACLYLTLPRCLPSQHTSNASGTQTRANPPIQPCR